jgi:hypothetical protein
MSDREFWIIRKHGSGSYNYRLNLRPIGVRKPHGLKSSDGEGDSSWASDSPIKTHGGLCNDKWATSSNRTYPFGIDCIRFNFEDAADYFDSRGLKFSCATSSLVRGIKHRNNNSADPGLDQCLCARTGSTGVATRLQRHKCSCTPRPLPCGSKRHNLSVRSASSTVKTSTDNVTIAINEHAANSRILTPWSTRIDCELQR